MIERAAKRWPAVPPTREERLARYREGLPPHDDELALRRKHGRQIQRGLFRLPEAVQYEAEAIATAHEVTEEDYRNATD